MKQHVVKRNNYDVWEMVVMSPRTEISTVNPVLSLVSQSGPTLSNAMDWSPPGSSVHGIL